MVDAEFLKWFTTLGVGGVLAGFMFVFYRKDVRQFTALWQIQTDVLMKLVRDNTAETTRLITVIDALHRRIDRDEWLTDHPPQRPPERSR